MQRTTHATAGRRTSLHPQSGLRGSVCFAYGISPCTWQDPSKAILSCLDASLTGLLEATAVPQSFYTRLRVCLNELREALRGLDEDWKVDAFGSSASGFATASSDFDITCYRTSAGKPIMLQHSHTDLLRLMPLLAKLKGFTIAKTVLEAKVPILKMRFDSSIDVDVGCHNICEMRNTRLLRAYADWNPRVRELVLTVKSWAQKEGVSGAVTGNISSYAFTIMAIYFLQVDSVVQMPAIPTNTFENLDPDLGDRFQSSWTCDLSLPILVYRFFWFYAAADGFDWGTELVDVRFGKRLLRHDFGQLNGWHTERLHIQDPFIVEKNLNCTLAIPQEHALRAKLLDAICSMQAGAVPTGLSCPTCDKESSIKS
jgi:DNA polymerase sigma